MRSRFTGMAGFMICQQHDINGFCLAVCLLSYFINDDITVNRASGATRKGAYVYKRPLASAIGLYKAKSFGIVPVT